jgi:hypothetical protein
MKNPFFALINMSVSAVGVSAFSYVPLAYVPPELMAKKSHKDGGHLSRIIRQMLNLLKSFFHEKVSSQAVNR